MFPFGTVIAAGFPVFINDFGMVKRRCWKCCRKYFQPFQRVPHCEFSINIHISAKR